MRHVFPTAQIPHKWAHQTQSNARNPQGNLFFEGPILYSYRTSYPIARIFTHKTKGQFVLLQENTYSSTTARHCYSARQAVSHLQTTTVPFVTCSYNENEWPGLHKKNLAYLTEEMLKYYEKSKRSLTRSTVDWQLREVRKLYSHIEEYQSFFNIRTKLPNKPDASIPLARITRLEQPDPKRDEKREKARIYREKAQLKKDAEKAEKYRIDHLERIAKFRAGEYTSFGSQYNAPVFLRLSKDGQSVETSRGASVPLAHAELLYKKIVHIMKTGIGYQHNGHTIHVGDFAVSSINPNGTLVAGCHTIFWDEINLLATSLGWGNQEVSHG